MSEERWQYTCLTCGHIGAGTPNSKYGCSRCTTNLKMQRSSNGRPYPVVHEGFFKKDCDCNECSVFWRKDNTISTSWVHDECTMTGKASSRIFDVFATSDPVAVLTASRVLGWGDLTITLKGWAERIRNLGGNHESLEPTKKLQVGLPISASLASLADKIEALQNE